MVSMNEKEYFEKLHTTELAISHLNRSFGMEVTGQLKATGSWNEAIAITMSLRSGENPVQPQDQLPLEPFHLTAEQIAAVEAHRAARRAEAQEAMAAQRTTPAPKIISPQAIGSARIDSVPPVRGDEQGR